MQNHTKLFLMEEVLVLWLFSSITLTDGEKKKQMKKEKQIMPK